MNLASTLQYSAERSPDAVALSEGGKQLTYVDLMDRVSSIAAGLVSLGVRQGDVVATVLKNRVENVEVFWACQWIGAVYLPLSWRNPPATVRYSLEDADARVVVFESVSEDHVRGLDQTMPLIGVGEASADRTFDQLGMGGSVPGRFDLDDRSTALMLYTSGTTGKPKGVPRSHRAERIASTAQALQHGYQVGERTLGVMPLYHTMGIHSLVSMALLGGCYAAQPDWDAAEAHSIIDVENISSLYLAPTLFFDLVDSDTRVGKPVRALGYAGAAMTGALVERCSEFFNPEVFVNHYGSTEIYCYTIGANQRRKPGNAGRASLNTRLRLVGMEATSGPDDVVADGEEGQIICHMSSDEAFAGYWNRPDANEAAIRQGWYFTGDLGRVDEEGDYWVVGRVDDMIISGGENIHPLEVEDVLARAPGVREVAVFAAPDDRFGQKVVAAVVTDPGVEVSQLDEFCIASEDLARYKRPREYRIVDELPKSPSGKILRRLLREEETS
ncbi:MAG: AMP-binding protein [Acidimicrobiia bacterium]